MTRSGALFFLLGCALLGGVFFALLERRVQVVQGPLRGEAARNPYLGAARMLEAMGLPVSVLEHPGELEELPPTDATLLMLGRRAYLTATQSARLRDWVERGGHLVVRAWHVFGDETERDPLLDDLGVRLLAPDDDEDDGDGDEEETGDEPRPPTSEKELARWSPEPGTVVRIEFDPRYALALDDAPESFETWADEADHGYSLPVGQGHITVWSDDTFLRNEAIGRWDHAELAYRLVRMHESSGNTFVVIRDVLRRSLTSRILESAWSVCIALGVWLAVYFWSIAPRFGPILPEPSIERRELMEHVRASGNFLLRNGGFDTLVRAVRSALLRRVQQRHPQWLHLDARARVQRVAEHTGLAPEDIEDALESAIPTHRDRLVKRIATLEAIRKRL